MIVSGVAFILGGVSLLFGIWGDVGALLLIVTLIPLTFLMHRFSFGLPYTVTDGAFRSAERDDRQRGPTSAGTSPATSAVTKSTRRTPSTSRS